MTERRYRRLVIGAWLIMGVPFAVSLVAYASGTQKQAGPAAASAGSGCILPAPAMRYRHMTYLKQRRDEVVRAGQRRDPTVPNLMTTCGGCHHDKAQFCDKCHARASVNLDCFGCHRY